MSPRFLIPLIFVMAAAGYESVNFWDAGKKRTQAEPPAGDSMVAGPGGCESCKSTPTNRFSLLAKQGSTGGGAAAETGVKSREDGSLEGGLETSSRLSKRWAKRVRLANASAAALEEEIQNSRSQRFMGSKDADYLFAVRRLAELNPERAAELWAKNGELRSEPDLFLKDWVQKDPAAFLAWHLNQTADVQKASAVTLGNILKESPQKFAELAAQLSQSPAGPAAARSAIQGMREAGADNPEKVLAYAQGLPEGALRSAAFVELFKWPEANAVSHPEMVAALMQLEPEDARRLGRELGKIASDLPAGVARESAFAASLGELAGKDPAAAARRLDALVGSPDYPAAVRGFVSQAAGKDPADAAEWALSIPASATLQRNSALERVASAWFKSSPDEARAWVERAPISDTEYFQLTGRPRRR